ncbi:MAG: bifunctional D-glycero-beta-D-manno-heptose-7-phosphate kinase/D-glycero-beta-D-manno-heptose 1-phosphate adenylyltransferase HldE [Desulfobacterales bacterium]|nr:bifunctional D-glycero-beta-D-manno-heptose-7-phosphate kinase/D-glycero-beta-D-manno-heptose 1-phosphate adenylyltransferase HldE [Desulfobacterales bacterium]
MKINVDANQLAASLKKTRILVVGDIMLDCYFWGEVSRISPEAPVPVVTVGKKTWSLGGAGNVATNLSGLGCEAALIGATGRDWAGEHLRELLSAAGVADLTVTEATRPTITKTRVMAQRQQIVRLDEEETRRLAADTETKILNAVKAELPRCRAMILSDYGKGMFLSADFTQQLIGLGLSRRIPVLVDPKGADWLRYSGATCITPNTAELEGVVGKKLDDETLLTKKAGALREKLRLEWLLVTRGSKGMGLFGNQPTPMILAAKAREVFDVSGAGDTVIATLAAAAATGMIFAQAAAVSNLAAGIVVGKLGTQPILWEELEQALTTENGKGIAPPVLKVATLSAARDTLENWRLKGNKIVFTNGCFDLLHPGHVSLLHQARHLGDKLVVGLNTDASIKRLKGDARPILAGKDRAAILSALEDVSLIVFFDEDTPLDLIGALKPDILVKGADYTIEAVVGREIVESYGGKVCLVDILDGYSTTNIAKKLSATGR